MIEMKKMSCFNNAKDSNGFFLRLFRVLLVDKWIHEFELHEDSWAAAPEGRKIFFSRAKTRIRMHALTKLRNDVANVV